MSRRTPSWPSIAGVCLASGVLAAAGCEGAFGPADEPAVYLLASIAHTRIDSTVNALEICVPELAAEGAEVRFLADTLLLYPDGRAIHHTHQWSRAADNVVAATPDRISYHEHTDTLRYVRLGRVVRFSDGRVFDAADFRSLEMGGWCGPWRWERAAANPQVR
jgi:hypothetical protein